jgi:hypothetical protein
VHGAESSKVLWLTELYSKFKSYLNELSTICFSASVWFSDDEVLFGKGLEGERGVCLVESVIAFRARTNITTDATFK